jgi:hypothetical protein
MIEPDWETQLAACPAHALAVLVPHRLEDADG